MLNVELIFKILKFKYRIVTNRRLSYNFITLQAMFFQFAAIFEILWTGVTKTTFLLVFVTFFLFLLIKFDSIIMTVAS